MADKARNFNTMKINMQIILGQTKLYKLFWVDFYNKPEGHLKDHQGKDLSM